jgi:hypothetical protein
MLRSCIRSTKWSRTAAGSRDQVSIFTGSTQALFTKHEASQLVSQLLNLLWVAGGAEAFRQLEEGFLFLLLGFDSLLDEFHQHAIVAESALPGQGLDLSGDFGRQGYASPDMLCVG